MSSRHRIIGVLTIVFVLGTVTFGQSPATEPAKLPPLDLKLTTTSMMLCIGSELPLNLELTNRGTDEIKIDRSEIWNSFQYGYHGDREKGRGGGQGSGCSDCRQDFVSVTRDKPYESSFKFPLTNDFFEDAGKYSIKLRFAGVSSNEVKFELYKCN